MKEIKTIIFDCDGVLIDSEIISCRIDAAELSQHGYDISVEEVIKRFAGVSDHEMYEIIEKEREQPFPSSFFARRASVIQDAFEHELQAIAGVKEVLTQLHLPICVTSNSTLGNLEKKLKLVGLYDRFVPNILSATMVPRGKPAPDLYFFTAGWMRVPPRNCIAVEDSAAGVRAANAAGMRVFGFCGGQHCFPDHEKQLMANGAELAFDRMNKLLELLTVRGLINPN